MDSDYRYDANDDYYTHIRPHNEGLDLLEFAIEPVVRETDKAVLIALEGVDVWIPKSQIVTRGDTTYLPRWLINRKYEEVENG